MNDATPARLYALVVGATLVIAGIVGFFYSADFGSPGEVDKVFGILGVNAWHNIIHIATGLVGLACAGYAARTYCLGFAAVYIVVAIWGFVIGSGDSILGFIPINTEDNVLHLVLAIGALAAAAATPATPIGREPLVTS
jgi:hypothetical protein